MPELDAARLAEFRDWERRAGPRLAARRQIVPQDVAFELRPTDVLVRMAAPPGGTSAAGDARTDLLTPIDGRTPYGAVIAAIPESERPHAAAWYHRMLGSFVSVPAAVAGLERNVPLAQLVRFPQQSPYAVPRPYWENAIAVRNALPRLYDAATANGGVAEALCALHRLATLGESGGNFYGAGNGLPTNPGALRQQPVRTWLTRPMFTTLARWLEHLDVREPLLGNGAVTTTAGTLLAELRDDGLACAHVDSVDAMQAALEDIRMTLVAALDAGRSGARDALIPACASLHQLLVATHPFTNVNNSIAMNIVNDLLPAAGAGTIPHLLLDYLALRMTPSGYANAFAAVCAHSGTAATDLLQVTTVAHFPVAFSTRTLTRT